MMVNDRMPEYCVERAERMLSNRFQKAICGAHILILGVAYKQDIDDYRESPALRVIECLEGRGAIVTFYDPWVKTYRYKGEEHDSIPELTPEALEIADLVMITCAHSNVDYDLVQQHAKAIFDTKNVMKGVENRENIEVL